MTLPPLKKVASSALSILRSTKFFYGVVVLLVIQAIWMALTARYPMAFDENFHWGIIKIYSQQWGPFITSTPPDSGEYGALIRTPSYLYHYLMSFPYRLFALFTNQETIQIILLRFINIGLFAAGLFMFRKALMKLRFSAAIAHFSLFMLVLIPVVPFLAGQINYDNLLFILVPAIALAALACGQDIVKENCVSPLSLARLLIIGLLGSLVKYAFLPIFFASLLYVIVPLIRNKNTQRVAKNTWASFTSSKLWLRLGIILVLTVSIGLFVERYGGNIIQYKSLDPDCAQVESIEHCKEYGPWARNYLLTTGVIPSGTDQTPFVIGWVSGIVHRLYFAINYDYINYYELPLPISAAYIFGFTGLLLMLCFSSRIFNTNPHLYLIGLILLVYTASLLYVNYSDYIRYDAFLALNGRYLIIVLPFLFGLIATAYNVVLQKKVFVKYAQQIKLGLVTAALLLSLQGGGILTYAVRSDPNWYWPNPLAKSLGQGLKDISSPFIIGADSKERG